MLDAVSASLGRPASPRPCQPPTEESRVSMLCIILAEITRRIEEGLASLRLERDRVESRRMHLCAALPPLPNDRLWSQKEAAAYIGRSTRWLRESTVPKVSLRGNGKGRRVGVRYEPEQVN